MRLAMKIVMDRMKGNIEVELDDAQSGFRQGKGTREGTTHATDFQNSLLFLIQWAERIGWPLMNHVSIVAQHSNNCDVFSIHRIYSLMLS